MSDLDRDDDQAARGSSGIVKQLAELAAGEKSPQDVVRDLRKEKVDALEVMVNLIDHASRASKSGRQCQQMIDVRRWAKRGSAERLGTKHKTPLVPFLLNGTLYDPTDIKRFEGVELHFIGAGDHLLAIDDWKMMARWWELSFMSSALESLWRDVAPYGVKPKTAKPPSGQPGETGSELPPYSPNPGFSRPGGPPTFAFNTPNTTYFYDDPNYSGSWIELTKNRGYSDLTEVGRGFLGLGDWNDVVSAVSTTLNVVVLHEHTNWRGATFTLFGSGGSNPSGYDNLTAYGWNDRASSVETW